MLDPDQQVQAAVRAFFAAFTRTGSATATVKSFRRQGLLFPRRLASGPYQGELVWRALQHSAALRALKNPRYAGAFVYGRTRTRRGAGGRDHVQKLPREQWHTLIRDAHPGYITWNEYEANLERLHQNAQAQGTDRRAGPPREGTALLQGLVVCGRCGERMTIRYHTRHGELVPVYVCQKAGIERAEPICQHIVGAEIDRAIGDLLVATVSPLALEVALRIQEELAARAEEADRIRRQQVERARYEAELAQRRYLRVDPDNRLVAGSLEAEWNSKLRALATAQEEYERQRDADGLALDDGARAEILALATDFPRLWRDVRTPQRERKRMARLLVEDVTLLKAERLVAHVRFRGGASQTLHLPLALCSWQMRQTDPAVIAEIDHLLDQHTEAEIAAILSARGLRPGVSETFTPRIVWMLRRDHGLEDRFTRLRRRGLLTLGEIAARLGVDPDTVKRWRRAGLLRSEKYNDKGVRLFEPPGPDAPIKNKHKFSRRALDGVLTDGAHEVQSVA